MKKLLALLLALVLAAGTTAGLVVGVFGFDAGALDRRAQSSHYTKSLYSLGALSAAMNADGTNILVLGSSELTGYNEECYPATLFNQGNSDFNMTFYGDAHTQSLALAYALAGIDSETPLDKVVLILSPQWFIRSGVGEGPFSSKFSMPMFVGMLKNPDLSDETKTNLVTRSLILLNADPTARQTASDFADLYLYHTATPLTALRLHIREAFLRFRADLDYIRETPEDDSDPAERVSAADALADMDGLLAAAEQQGIDSCTNNDWAIYDEFYDDSIRDKLESLENSFVDAPNGSYSISPEYGHLKIFLETCRDLGIEAMLVSVPVNGRWYDYGGFDPEDRQGYYEKIREIAAEYDVELADFSDQEYTDYFLRDTMHLGWKGWVYVDEAIYEFAQ